MAAGSGHQLPPEFLALYRPEEVLGRGATSIVIRARQLALDRPVVVKVLELVNRESATVRARFEREAKLLAGLDHPNLLRILDYGLVGGVAYMAYPDEPGTSFDVQVRERPPLDVEEVRAILEELLAGLAYLHQHGVVHRDLKPANLLRREDGSLLILDLGLARDLGAAEALTWTGAVLGTPFFMAPDQFFGREPDPSDDVYSVGLIAWKFLTGRGLFEEVETFEELARRSRDEVPPPLRQERPDVPEDLSRLVKRMLAKSREDRPTAAQALDHIRQAAGTPGGLPAPAPPRPGYGLGVLGGILLAFLVLATRVDLGWIAPPASPVVSEGREETGGREGARVAFAALEELLDSSESPATPDGRFRRRRTPALVWEALQEPTLLRRIRELLEALDGWLDAPRPPEAEPPWEALEQVEALRELFQDLGRAIGVWKTLMAGIDRQEGAWQSLSQRDEAADRWKAIQELVEDFLERQATALDRSPDPLRLGASVRLAVSIDSRRLQAWLGRLTDHAAAGGPPVDRDGLILDLVSDSLRSRRTLGRLDCPTRWRMVPVLQSWGARMATRLGPGNGIRVWKGLVRLGVDVISLCPGEELETRGFEALAAAREAESAPMVMLRNPELLEQLGELSSDLRSSKLVEIPGGRALRDRLLALVEGVRREVDGAPER